jgi:aryl-alcohol dehydrogenase-like predicted oxidoreductase
VPGSEPFVSSQPQYSILSREPEREVIPFCAEHGISQIVWSPLAQGVLNVTAAIVGASRPEQVEENAGASGIELDESVIAAIDAATAGVVQAR